MMGLDGRTFVRSGGAAHVADARGRPDRQLFYARFWPIEGHCQGGAEKPQAFWRSAGTDDSGTGLLRGVPATGTGSAGSVGDHSVATFGAGRSRADGSAEFFCGGDGPDASGTRPAGFGVSAARLGAGADNGGAAMDAADVFPALAHPPDGAVARPAALHRLQRATAGRRGEFS